MNPFFFGASERALFGSYHAPGDQPGRNLGVVLCNPFGDEAIKAHRAYLQLARMLAAARFHVLRFDYFATGDSMGDGGEGTVAQWLQDIGDAATELKDVSGVSKVALVGLRYGASLALQAASGRRDLANLVLWDPVVDGGDYLAELHKAHEAYVSLEFGGHGPDRQASGMGRDEVMGFALGGELRRAIEDTDLLSFTPKRLKRATIIASSNSPRYQRLRDSLAEQKVKVSYEHVPVGVNWNADDASGTSLVPMEALKTIVAALS